MKPKVIAYLELALLALLLALFLWWIYPENQNTNIESNEPRATTTSVALFPSVSIEAKSAYIYDVVSGKVLYEKDASLRLPLASLAKVMSAFTASELLPDYMLIRITASDVREEGDTGLYPDESWNVKNLIDYSLMVSSNDGVKALASVAGSQISATSTTPEKLFVEKMNASARAIGLKDTYFINQSGLDVNSSLSGGYGSARDMAALVDHVLKTKPGLLEATSLPATVISSKDFLHTAENTNKTLGDIPNVIASKTGYTELSGGNLVVAFNAGLNHPIIISVLGSSYDGRFSDMEALVGATLEYLSGSHIVSIDSTR